MKDFNKITKHLKSSLKTKIKLTKALVITFLITGTLTLASGNIENSINKPGNIRTGVATTDTATAIGDGSISTGENTTAVGTNSVATGNGFTREDYNRKKEELQGFINEKKQKQNELDNLKNQKDANSNTIDGYGNQISAIGDRLRVVETLTREKEDKLNQKQEKENEKARLEEEYNNKKGQYAGFVDERGEIKKLDLTKILEGLNWDKLNEGDGETKKLELARDLKAEIDRNFSDFTNQYDETKYKKIIDGYLNRQGSIQGTIEWLNKKKKDNLFNNFVNEEHMKKIGKDYEWSKDYLTSEEWDKLRKENKLRRYYEEYIDNTYGETHIEKWRGELLLNDTPAEKEKTFNKLKNALLLHEFSAEKLNKDNQFNGVYLQFLDGTQKYLLKAKTGDNFKFNPNEEKPSYSSSSSSYYYYTSSYSTAYSSSYSSSSSSLDSYSYFNSKYSSYSYSSSSHYSYSFRENYKALTTDGENSNYGFGASNSQFYKKDKPYIALLYKYDREEFYNKPMYQRFNELINEQDTINPNLLSLDEIQGLLYMNQNIHNIYNTIDWEHDKSVIDLNDYKAKFQVAMNYSDKVKEWAELYKEIVELSRDGGNQETINQKTVELMKKREELNNLRKADPNSQFENIEIVKNHENIKYYMEYGKAEYDEFMNEWADRLNTGLKLYDQENEIAVAFKNKAEEVLNELNTAKQGLDNTNNEINRLEREILAIDLSPEDNNLLDKKRELEGKLAKARERENELNNNIRDKENEINDLDTRIRNTNLGSIGLNSQASGKEAFASGENSIAMGTTSTVTGNKSIGIGINTNVSGVSSIAIGDGNTISGDKSIAIGVGHNVVGEGSSTMGDPNNVYGNNNHIYGNNNNVGTQAAPKSNNFILGSNVDATNVEDSITLGNNSKAISGAVSVGSENATRKIHYVKEAEISATSKEAVNGSQLFALADGSLGDINVDAWKNKLGITGNNNNSQPVNVDLSNYYNKAETDNKLNDKANKNLDNLGTISDAGKSKLKEALITGDLDNPNGNLVSDTKIKEKLDLKLNKSDFVKADLRGDSIINISGTGKILDSNLTLSINDNSISKSKLAKPLKDEIDNKVSKELLVAGLRLKADKDGANLEASDITKWREKLGITDDGNVIANILSVDYTDDSKTEINLGKDGNLTTIHNVNIPKEDTDAANKIYVDMKTSEALNGIKSYVNNASAMANIPQVAGDKLFSFGAGAAYNGGKVGSFALGISGQDKKKKFIYKASAGLSTDLKWQVALGFSYSLGNTDTDTNGNINFDKLMAENEKLKGNLKDLNKDKDDKIDNLKAEIEKLKDLITNINNNKEKVEVVGVSERRFVINNFNFDKFGLKEEHIKLLDEILNSITSENSIEIIGYTDMKGKDKYNLNLGLNRAKAVMDYLLDKNNDLNIRVYSQGFNKILNKDDSKLRRVEIIIK